MIVSTLAFAAHILISSFKILKPVHQVLEYLVPLYRNVAAKSIKGPRIDFDTRHLKKGDPLPPFNGKLRVYNMRYCPFAQRTILALNAKGLDYEVVNIDPVDQPDWFMTKSLFGQLPAVEVAVGVTLCESLVIVNYIDDVYPQRPLRARDPLRHAHDQMLIEALTPMHTVLFKLVHAPATIDENVINAYFKALTYTQEQLKKRGTTFLSGNEPGYVDYMIWPWIEKMLAFQKVDARFKFDTPSYELLTKYAQKMIEDSTVNQYAVSDEIYLEAMDGYKSGKVFEYDLLLKYKK